jgi:hypothetical protein
MMIWQFAQVAAIAHQASVIVVTMTKAASHLIEAETMEKVLVISLLPARRRAPAELLVPLKREQLHTSIRAKRADIISAR